MGFIQAVTTCLKKSFDPSGRALRSEFWYFMLFMVLVNILFTLTGLFGEAFCAPSSVADARVGLRRGAAAS